MLNYIVYTIIGLGCSFVVYQLILKSEKTFQFNRFFLLATLVLCLVSPLMELEIFSTMPSITEIDFQSLPNKSMADEMHVGTTVETVERTRNMTETAFVIIYILVTILLLLRFSINLCRMLKLIKSDSKKIGAMKLIQIDDQKNTSSFFNYLFIDPKLLEDGVYTESVLTHETVHYQQLHTLDVLIVELLWVVFWFNPFVWLYKKQIKENHEFIADALSVKSGIDIMAYSNSIISSGKTSFYTPLTSGFNFNHIKNRLLMLHQSKSSGVKRTFKSVMAILLFTSIFTLSSFKDSKPPLVVIVDAGHGGKDSGNSNEKDVVLQISQKLMRYSDQKVKVILTRTTDEFLSLSERTDFIKKHNPDLLLSLHSNANQDADENGVEAFYYAKNAHSEISHSYSKILVEDQLDVFSDRGAIKTAGFYILKNSDCPGVLLELGFITNAKDKAFLTDSDHQDNIAKSLYKSLLKIREAKTK